MLQGQFAATQGDDEREKRLTPEANSTASGARGRKTSHRFHVLAAFAALRDDRERVGERGVETTRVDALGQQGNSARQERASGMEDDAGGWEFHADGSTSSPTMPALWFTEDAAH